MGYKMKLIIVTLLIFLAIGITVLNSGAYNMAATDKHWAITEDIIEWVRDSSIKARAEKVVVPSLDDPALILRGAEHYLDMCAGCHSQPGQEPTELALGLYPQPPVFYLREQITNQETITERARAYFWVIKNGLKMTGMPAWGLSHQDDDIWAMTAFILAIHGMTTEQYRLLVNSNTDQQNENNGHHHDNGDHHH